MKPLLSTIGNKNNRKWLIILQYKEFMEMKHKVHRKQMLEGCGRSQDKYVIGLFFFFFKLFVLCNFKIGNAFKSHSAQYECGQIL